jgi:glutamyl-tRNA synthetase
MSESDSSIYRGRIAPSPTGYLHLGHALTFRTARERAVGGVLALRIEDLDASRCRAEYRDAIVEDLRWFGIKWEEGPDVGGAYGPYVQSLRDYLPVWRRLRDAGLIYPCTCSRRDVLSAVSAPHEEEQAGGDEPLYPGTCRRRPGEVVEAEGPAGVNWRFRVPDGEEVCFEDGRAGERRAVAGRDFGDFIVWRKDNIPSYQLAVVADDAAMAITEVVRGGGPTAIDVPADFALPGARARAAGLVSLRAGAGRGGPAPGKETRGAELAGDEAGRVPSQSRLTTITRASATSSFRT